MFFIYLYQRWIYPIDPKRVNEFGLTGEPTAESEIAVHNPQQNEETKAIEKGTSYSDDGVVPDKKND